MKLRHHLQCGAAILAAALGACDQGGPSAEQPEKKPGQVTADEVLQSARETLQKAGKLVEQERDYVVKSLEREIAALDVQIADLKRQANAELAPRIAELERQKEELMKVWAKAMDYSSDKWDEVKKRFNHDWKEEEARSSLDWKDKTSPASSPSPTPEAVER